MKYLSKRHLISYISIFTFVLLSTAIASAQLRIPRASQGASIKQTIGVTDVTIAYSRPAVKGRKLWGDAPATSPKGEATLDGGDEGPLVPNGHVWRTGANEATQFVVTDDVLINGQPLAAGSYSLHTIPGKDEWSIVFNGTANQWGSFNYDASKDTLRVKVKPQWVTDNQELMMFGIDPVTENSAIVSLRWEKIRVPFTVEVKDVPAITLAKARVAVAAAKADDWQTPLNAAVYAKANKSPDESAKWFEQSLKIVDEQIKTKETFQNLSRKATILVRAGRMQDAIAAAEAAVVRGKADGVKASDIEALQKRIADIKAGKM